MRTLRAIAQVLFCLPFLIANGGGGYAQGTIQGTPVGSRSTKLEVFKKGGSNDSSKTDTAIIFVHGLFGSELSWQRASTIHYWPQIIRDDPDFARADVFVYSYPTDFAAPEVTIEAIAKHAQGMLANEKIDGYKHVVFVAHSMGGLVVKTMLIGNQELTRRANVHVHLFGVPTTTVEFSGLIGWAYNLSDAIKKNPEYLNQLVDPRSQTLFSIHSHFWDAIKARVSVSCYFEGRATALTHYGVKYEKFIVRQNQAGAHCDSSIPLNDHDHHEIVKPVGIGDSIHVAFRQKFLDTLRKAEQTVGPVHPPSPGNLSGQLFLDTFPGGTVNKLWPVQPMKEYVNRATGIILPAGTYFWESTVGEKKRIELVEVLATRQARATINFEEIEPVVAKSSDEPRICFRSSVDADITMQHNGVAKRIKVSAAESRDGKCAWTESQLPPGTRLTYTARNPNCETYVGSVDVGPRSKIERLLMNCQ